jgi:elongation factor Ts
VSRVADIPAKDVKALRDRTGAGMMDCKAALEEAGGDIDKAVEILRVKGQAQAAKRGGRAASEGLVTSYVHATGKIGVLVEVDCETDFVANTEQFQEFGRDLAIHVAAAAPRYVSEEDVPGEEREAELRIFREQAAGSGAERSGPSGARGKPEDVQEKIAEGRLRKWLEEVVLLRQRHVNDEKHGGKTIGELRTELAASTGENVVVRRFVRFQIGEE